jgi:uncharacterized protein (DUF1684 family)
MSFESDQNAWRSAREKGLKKDFGWLSLAGLFFLSEGENPVGPDGAVTVARAPGTLGSYVLDGDSVKFVTPEGLWWPLVGDKEGSETAVLKFEQVSLSLVWRQERWAVRLRDNLADTRTHFQGLAWHAPDPAWNLEGRWEPFVPAQTITIKNVLGHESSQQFDGKAVLDTPAGPLELWGQDHGQGSIFLNFRDQTSGKTTYGSGRFLDAQAADGRIRVDFNKAYNPPCAFTPFATCPLPPRQNVVDVAVPAGELLPPGYQGH